MTEQKPSPKNTEELNPAENSDFENHKSDNQNCNGSTEPGAGEAEHIEKEFGGFENKKEPTRYGDWEVGGRCSDF